MVPPILHLLHRCLTDKVVATALRAFLGFYQILCRGIIALPFPIKKIKTIAFFMNYFIGSLLITSKSLAPLVMTLSHVQQNKNLLCQSITKGDVGIS